MSHEPDVDRTVVVSDDDVRVEKSFAREEFPVPAIKFRLVSEGEEPVHVRLIDQIPEDFPMESVGFHPDYESDNWTAYKDHRVEYERSLEPGESTVTVYGIRLEDSSDIAGFLGEPILERPPVPGEAPEDRPGADVDDILGTDRSQLVRDALQGNGRLANQEPAEPERADPGVEPVADDERTAADAEATPAADREPDADAEAATGIDAEATSDSDTPPDVEAETVPETDAETDSDAETDDATEPPAPRTVPSDLTPVVRREPDAVTPAAPDEGAEPVAADSEPEPDATTDADSPAGDAAADGTATDTETEGEADTDAYVDIGAEAEGEAAAAADDAAEPTPAAEADAGSGGLAATLAAEIRAGEVSEADLETLRGEFDPGLPRSADVRIRRLQSQLADLETYTDALEEFIDEEGTGAELVERLDSELEAVTAELDDVREGLDAAAEDREAIRDEIGAVDDDLAATDERLDAVDETATEAAEGVEDLHERADAIEDHLDDVESDVDSVVDDLDDIAAEIDDVAADLDDTDEYVSDLDDDVADVRSEVSAVGDDLEDARSSLSADVADLRAEVAALTDELERLDAIEADIEQLQTFRERLNSAFGPGGGGSGGSGASADSADGGGDANEGDDTDEGGDDTE